MARVGQVSTGMRSTKMVFPFNSSCFSLLLSHVICKCVSFSRSHLCQALSWWLTEWLYFLCWEEYEPKRSAGVTAGWSPRQEGLPYPTATRCIIPSTACVSRPLRVSRGFLWTEGLTQVQLPPRIASAQLGEVSWAGGKAESVVTAEGDASFQL